MSKNNGNQAGNEKNRRKLRILLAPLDWGLGHATRCIPVVYELIRQNVDVWLAAEGAQEQLLKKEFPDLPFLPLEGYRVKYARSAAGLVRNLLFQTPRLLGKIRKENKWLKTVVKEYAFDAVISDNRFGLYHSNIPSVFITHQLMIKNPLGKWMSRLLQKLNYRFIDRFTECWVPDHARPVQFAGQLSHPEKKPTLPVHYIGILSRLAKAGIEEKKNHLFISLSGPEPQRTLLENIVITEISHYNGTATVVRGLPATESLIPSTNDIRFYNHLPSTEYNREMERAEWVISRSGYSTIMDIVKLGKKSILIPTPGQTEQEYLAVHLEQLQIACSMKQKELSLEKLLSKGQAFEYRFPVIEDNAALSNTIEAFLAAIAKKSVNTFAGKSGRR